MPGLHDKPTIISMAVISSAAATFLHEGVGHGVLAWLLGAEPTALTSNHLSSVRPDHWVEAGGTLVNLAVGALALYASASPGGTANRRYFLWILGALNLLPGAGYFLFSGILAMGDWHEIIKALPNQLLLHVLMAVFGFALYWFVVSRIAKAAHPFCENRSEYNTVARLPYYAACIFSCAAGALDPLGFALFIGSTVPAAFGGSSGLMWGDSLMPRSQPAAVLHVTRQPAWWVAALILGGAFIAILGPGIQFK